MELPAAPPHGVGVPETVEGSTKICFFFFFGQDAQEIQNASRCNKIIGSAIAELLSKDDSNSMFFLERTISLEGD